MVSYNHKFENLGIHRVSRIISASISTEEYISPEVSGFIDDYISSAWHVIPGFENISEGVIILTAEVPDLYEVARWVMSGAPHIKVIEPEELKEIIMNFTEEMLQPV